MTRAEQQAIKNAREYEIGLAMQDISFGATGDDLKRRGFDLDIIDEAQERFVKGQPEE